MLMLVLGFGLLAVLLLLWSLLAFSERGADWYYRRMLAVLQETLREFYCFMDARHLLSSIIAIFMVLSLLALGFSASWKTAVLVLVSCLCCPFIALPWLRRARRQRLAAQLPDFMQALAAALQAGAGVHNAFQGLAQQAPDPLGQELRFMLRQWRVGVSLPASLSLMHARVPVVGLLVLRACLELGTQQGGGMAESLMHLSSSLRQAIYLRARVLALTAQARMQAWLMCLLPVVLGAVLYTLSPEGWAWVWTGQAGLVLLTFIGLLMGAGVLLTRRIMRSVL